MIALYHAKMSGFLSESGTYTSEWKEAKRFDYDTAIKLCRRAMLEDAFVLIPIHYDDLVVVAEGHKQ